VNNSLNILLIYTVLFIYLDEAPLEKLPQQKIPEKVYGDTVCLSEIAIEIYFGTAMHCTTVTARLIVDIVEMTFPFVAILFPIHDKIEYF
jgi:hypothetical protein